MPIDAAIRNIIKEKGYITIDDVMRQTLTDNSDSYYKNVKNLGQYGDFITSPELSQLFGEMIALWCIQRWQKIGKPSDFVLLELGPGHGSLMSDLIRVAKVEPDFLDAVHIYLYEVNPHFIAKQKSILGQGIRTKWVSNLNDLPDLPLLVVANEFFDALPIKQYMKIKLKWYESVMVVDPIDAKIKYDTININGNLQKQFAIDYIHSPDGGIIEESLDSLNIIREISKKIIENTGSALVIDYGYHVSPHSRTSTQYNSTLQAMKNHKYVSIIDTLGEADITAHVDFYALQKASKESGRSFFSFKNQEEFLVEHGIYFRAEMLKKSLSTDDKLVIDRQVKRLVSKEFMGGLFKVLEISSRADN